METKCILWDARLFFEEKFSRLTKLKSVQNQSQFGFDNLPFLCLPGRSNRYDISCILIGKELRMNSALKHRTQNSP